MFKPIIVLIIIFIIWLASPLILNHFIIPFLGLGANEISGVYTAVAALFSALAFSILLLTLWLQKKQLDIQKNELEVAKIENKKNIQISAYSALLTYYNGSNSFDPNVSELTPMDIAKKLNALLKKSTLE